MERPKGGTNIGHSKEEKSAPVKRVLAGEALRRLERESEHHSVTELCDDIHKVVADTIYYFNYIRPVRKLKRKPPVQYRNELAV